MERSSVGPSFCTPLPFAGILIFHLWTWPSLSYFISFFLVEAPDFQPSMSWFHIEKCQSKKRVIPSAPLCVYLTFTSFAQHIYILFLIVIWLMSLHLTNLELLLWDLSVCVCVCIGAWLLRSLTLKSTLLATQHFIHEYVMV